MKSSIPDFRVWLARMGFNSRQVAAGAELIGIKNARTASSTNTGARDLMVSERLAMSAVRVGLKPWSPEYDDELVAQGMAHRTSNAA
ncbi:hypothetical protein [Aquibium microcysteis]|uniref:hypothetical protein n=1 Tax=Aquibium microcysteis TaxID=675281 RepID=UPI00165D1420|nr:hypothetical protein [Aquibium microcysteis]